MTYRTAALLAAFVALALPTFCQVKAYTDKTEQIKEIVPPMVLEIPLREMVEQGENKEWVTTETKGFSCLGVVAEKVTVWFRAVGQNDSEYEVRGVVYLRNTKPEDTQTSLGYALVAGPATLATSSHPGFATEENKPRFRMFKLVVPAKDVQDLKGCLLRISLTVVPD